MEGRRGRVGVRGGEEREGVGIWRGEGGELARVCGDTQTTKPCELIVNSLNSSIRLGSWGHRVSTIHGVTKDENYFLKP